MQTYVIGHDEHVHVVRNVQKTYFGRYLPFQKVVSLRGDGSLLRWKLPLTAFVFGGSNLPLLPVIFILPGNSPVIFLLFYITAVILSCPRRGNITVIFVKQ
jgi:hypothetical protein